MKMLKKIVFYIWMKPNNLLNMEEKERRAHIYKKRKGKRIANKGVRRDKK